MIIDTHTHIYLNEEKTPEEIISGLKNDDISHIISIGTDLKNSQISIDLAKQNPGVIYATIGIHPTDILEYKDSIPESMIQLENILQENRSFIRWIWECGFDFHHIDKNNFEAEKKLQEDFFKAQIALAQKYDLPVIIHSRDSKDDTLRVLTEMGAKKFVLHCFSEDLDFALKAIYYSDECMISFSGIVTYKSAVNVQKTAANIPLERILVETDCPFLSPQAVRGTENIPNNTKYNLQKVFELRHENGKKETFEEVEKEIFENSKRFFTL